MAKMSKRGMTKKFLIAEMDRSVKRMLKLIEEEGDSFAKKAEIYYQKRPVLVSQVEEFYRMFRSLAERYDNVTHELKRSLPVDIRSQGSAISDVCSEPPSAITSPDHNRLTRRLSAPRTIFDEETSTMDSGSDSDDSFFNSYSSASNYGNYRRLRKKITELEAELRKVQMEQEENRSSTEIAYYKEELQIAKEKIQSLEEEIDKLRMKLETYETNGPPNYAISKQERESGDCEKREVSNLQEQVTKLMKKRALVDHIREWDRSRSLEDDLRRVRIEKTEMEDEMEELKAEKEGLVARVSELEEETSLKDDQMDQMNERLHELRLKYEKSSKSLEESRCRGREFEKVIEKQREVIEEGAEEKRQAVRQLCISLEHYRNAYQMLRQDLLEQKKPVMAS